jgi:hypothetical protein
MARTKTGARQRGEPEVWGAKEASAALGVRQPNLRTIRGLPEPYDKTAATTLWRADEIRMLAEQREAQRTVLEGESKAA